MHEAGPAQEAHFAPTLREVMLRPRWLSVLALCLVVAGVFAWLGQWQLERAIDSNPPDPGMTEEVVALADIVAPGEYLAEPSVGQRVVVSGSFVPGDFIVVSGRYNDGVPGFWVSGQLRIADTAVPTSIAVAVGFAPERATADAAAAALNDKRQQELTVTGRIISDEGAMAPSRSEPITEQRRMSTAALLNLWHDADGIDVYRPFLVADTALGELLPISSPAPELASPINWLNLFYAVEWAVFAGFAFYLWYRLAKDAWERDVEAFEDAEGSEATS